MYSLKPEIKKFFHGPVLLCLLTAWPVAAQDFSYDGNRWYEIEISVFTNTAIPSAYPEQAQASNIDLAYPEDILKLSPPDASLRIPFDSPTDTSSLAEPALPIPAEAKDINSQTGFFDQDTLVASAGISTAEIDTVIYGPPYSPADTGFRILDIATDPYIALDERFHEFTRHNTRLVNSPDHRLLFHAVWRQPVLNKVQASAVYIEGGEQFGQHHELEGSIVISYNVNRVDADLRLWLSSFWPVFDEEESQWILPPPPFAEAPAEAEPEVAEMPRPSLFSRRPAEPKFIVDNLGYIEQTRSMISNELHYIDHPDFGVLIEVRPYQLPDELENEE